MISLVIVDDEKNIREGLRDLFPWEELGITVTCAAANGKEALSYIETHGADLVLADIRMPVMDGLELARHIQNSCPKTRVVLLSAYTDFAYAKKALRLGVCQYITKPVDYQELIDTIKLLTAPRPETSYQGYYQEMAQKILRYIEENPAQATLSGAAARVGLSPNYVSQILKQVYDENFSDRLLACRMTRARKLLDQGIDARIAAQESGYLNFRSFTGAFTRYYGISPYQYCQSARKEDSDA